MSVFRIYIIGREYIFWLRLKINGGKVPVLKNLASDH